MEDFELFKDAEYSDRTEVLSKTKNITAIRKFFNGNIDFSYENDRFHSRTTNIRVPQFELTEKYGILFSEKAGSSAIIGLLNKFKLSDLDISNHDDYVNFMTCKATRNEIKKDSEELSYVNEILDGLSKKDLIIVTRNPVYKFLSGIYQDISGELEDSNILTQVIHNSFGYPNNSKFETKQNKIKYISEEALSFLSYNILKGRLSNGDLVASGHSRLYNEFYFNLLVNNNIDKSKLTIVDIDDPGCDLIKCLGDYNPEILNDSNSESFWTHRPYHKTILDGISKLCGEHSDITLLEKIKQEVSNDFYYYKLLRDHYTEFLYKK